MTAYHKIVKSKKDMKKYTFTEIGEFHTTHNEDALVVTDIDKNRTLLAVMDGCSMGTESHFASTLIAKLLRKIGKELYYRAFAEGESKTNLWYLNTILRTVFQELKMIKNQLMLETEELLSTIILGVFDTKNRSCELIVVGDGLVVADGALFEFEQDDKPDYLGYHLAKDFDIWLEQQTQRLSLSAINDLSISTDGIFTFKNFDGKVYDEISEKEIIEFLLMDKRWSEEDQMLRRKVLEIERLYGLKPSDDLSIVRII